MIKKQIKGVYMFWQPFSFFALITYIGMVKDNHSQDSIGDVAYTTIITGIVVIGILILIALISDKRL